MGQIDLLFQNGFYFSYGLDLTKNYLHSIHRTNYMWNYNLLEEILQHEFSDWGVPVIRGFYRELHLGYKIKYCVMTRRIFPKRSGETVLRVGLEFFFEFFFEICIKMIG